MTQIEEIVRKRRSVRSYDGSKLNETTVKTLQDYMDSITNPYDIPVTFRIFDSAENDLSCPVVTGETAYILAKVKKVPHAEEAYGFAFEKMMLKAFEMGLGTVMIGGTMKREIFERLMDLKEDEMMPCITPIGVPAKSMSFREKMMRKGIGADQRKDGSELFFENDFSSPLKTDDERIAKALRFVQAAPSAVNKQPWRIVREGQTFHFFEKKDKGYIGDSTGDMQKIDLGIALCNFIVSLEEDKLSCSISFTAPSVALPEKTEYIASVKVEGI